MNFSFVLISFINFGSNLSVNDKKLSQFSKISYFRNIIKFYKFKT